MNSTVGKVIATVVGVPLECLSHFLQSQVLDHS